MIYNVPYNIIIIIDNNMIYLFMNVHDILGRLVLLL